MGTIREFLRTEGGLYKDQHGRLWTAEELLAVMADHELDAPVSLLYVGFRAPSLTLVRQKPITPFPLARAN